MKTPKPENPRRLLARLRRATILKMAATGTMNYKDICRVTNLSETRVRKTLAAHGWGMLMVSPTERAQIMAQRGAKKLEAA